MCALQTLSFAVWCLATCPRSAEVAETSLEQVSIPIPHNGSCAAATTVCFYQLWGYHAYYALDRRSRQKEENWARSFASDLIDRLLQFVYINYVSLYTSHHIGYRPLSSAWVLIHQWAAIICTLENYVLLFLLYEYEIWVEYFIIPRGWPHVRFTSKWKNTREND